MITNPALYASFKARSHASQDLSLERKYAILEALYEEACGLGYFAEHDLLHGLEDNIRLGAALNANVPPLPLEAGARQPTAGNPGHGPAGNAASLLPQGS
jgi:hypothetical protein